MAETYVEFVNRLLRDHEGYTGDGKGSVGDLPVGDRRTAVRPIIKRDLREVVLAGENAVDRALDAATDAQEAAGAAAASASSATGTPQFATRGAASTATVPAFASHIIVDGVGYVRDASGVALTTGGGEAWSPVGTRVTARAYGCAGDGVADDRARLMTALTDTRARGMILDGEGLTYRVGAALTARPGHIENLTIDARAITADIAWDISGPGFEGTKPMVANARQGERVLQVTAHGYAVGDVVLARSDMELESGTISRCAFWAEVTAVTANTITLSHGLLFNLFVGNNARVQRLPKMAGVRLRNVRVLGSATCPGGIQMTRLYRPVVEDMEAVNTEIRGLSLVHCFAPRTGHVHGDGCDRAGLGYAINVNGCGWAEIGRTTGRRCRHVLTWGEFNGIPCTGGVRGDVIGAECLGSVYDEHPGVVGIQSAGVVRGDMSPEYSGQDAITLQGAGGTVAAMIHGTFGRHLCLVQPFHNAGAFDALPSYDVAVEGDSTNGQGVSLDFNNTVGARAVRVRVVGNHSAESVFARIANGGVIGLLEIEGMATSGVRAININQQTSGQIGTAILSGRFRTTNASLAAAQVIGPTSTATPRTNVAVSGLDASGGTHGLRLDNRADARGASAAFLAGGTAPTLAASGATIS